MFDISLLNTWDQDGGAARATYRLHCGLRAAGVRSKLLVQEKTANDESILAPPKTWQRQLAKIHGQLDSLPLRRYHKRSTSLFSAAWLRNGVPSWIVDRAPDLVHLHWVNAGFLRIESLRAISQPIVWTLHDMWPFTGGCHYTGECQRFEETCGACYQLGSKRERDLSRRIWQRKWNAWKNVNLSIVTPSAWMAREARASSLFRDRRIEVIANGLDLQRFRPVEKETARDLLKLPPGVPLILFGAMDSTSDRRKGFHLLESALESLAKDPAMKGTEVVVFGASKPEKPLKLGFPVHYLGTFRDETSLALVYSAADVFAAPSLEDNLPNTVAEALACGVPVVAFAAGGLPEMVDHESNGYLARPFEPEDLSRGLRWVLEDGARRRALSHEARAKAESAYDAEQCAASHIRLYEELLDREPHRPVRRQRDLISSV